MSPEGGISGLHDPQGILYLPHPNRLYVANGDDGTLRQVARGRGLRRCLLRFRNETDLCKRRRGSHFCVPETGRQSIQPDREHTNQKGSTNKLLLARFAVPLCRRQAARVRGTNSGSCFVSQ